MKKITLILIILLTAGICFGQTEQIEKNNLSKMFEEGKFDREGYIERAKVWRTLLEDYGGYPSLPYNENTESIQFINYLDFSAISKKIIFNRIIEWAALNFGSIDAVLNYKNYESGKIILKDSFNIKHRTTYKNFWGATKKAITSKMCLQTYIFTIKDDKIKFEITNIRYKYKRYGYYTGSYFHPTEIYEMSIHELYPITEFEPKEWKENLDMIYQTQVTIQMLGKQLESYILNYQNDYKF